MYRKIIEYLYCFKDTQWHPINELLKELFGDNQNEARTILVELVQANRITIKDKRHEALTTYKNLSGNDPENTMVTFDNWIIEGKLTEPEKEKMDKEMSQPSTKDYKFEILAFLFKQGGQTVNIRPFINELVSDGLHSGVWFGTQLNSMRTKKHIWFDDVLCLSWVKNSMYSEDHPIKARLDPDGVAEYHRLNNLYNPPPPEPQIKIITYGNNSPAAGGDLTQNLNKGESKEGRKISKKTLAWTIAIGLILIILTVLLLIKGG